MSLLNRRTAGLYLVVLAIGYLVGVGADQLGGGKIPARDRLQTCKCERCPENATRGHGCEVLCDFRTDGQLKPVCSEKDDTICICNPGYCTRRVNDTLKWDKICVKKATQTVCDWQTLECEERPWGWEKENEGTPTLPPDEVITTKPPHKPISPRGEEVS